MNVTKHACSLSCNLERKCNAQNVSVKLHDVKNDVHITNNILPNHDSIGDCTDRKQALKNFLRSQDCHYLNKNKRHKLKKVLCKYDSLSMLGNDSL